MTSNDDPAPSLYSRVGGAPFFERLVDSFYDGVATDEVLLPLYPEQPDLTGARHRLTLFLVQYWGGPTTYMEERGHPRLRMRHMPFHVGPLERDRWLVHMAAAVESACDDPSVPSGVADELMTYFAPAAEHLRNDTGLPISSARPADVLPSGAGMAVMGAAPFVSIRSDPSERSRSALIEHG